MRIGTPLPAESFSRVPQAFLRLTLTKYQNWRTAILSSNLTLSGNINLTLWSAMKDFGTGKRGTVTAYLRDFNGSTYTTIATATLDKADWSTGSSGWKEKRLRLMALVIQYRPEPDSKSR